MKEIKRKFDTIQQKSFQKYIKYELTNEYSLRNSNFLPAPQPIIKILDLGSSLIHKWIITDLYRNSLLEAYNDNQIENINNNMTEYEFYTDGSLKDRGNIQMSMGSSWIQTLGSNPNTTFKTGSTSWPSSFKAETIAIFTVLLIISEGKKVIIYTDSQACIDTFHKISTPHPKFTKRKLLKVINWNI